MGKKPTCNVGDAGDVCSIPGSGSSSWRKAWQLTPIFLPGESHGQRSLAGYGPQGHNEWNMTEATEHACIQKLSWIKQIEM